MSILKYCKVTGGARDSEESELPDSKRSRIDESADIDSDSSSSELVGDDVESAANQRNDSSSVLTPTATGSSATESSMDNAKRKQASMFSSDWLSGLPMCYF